MYIQLLELIDSWGGSATARSLLKRRFWSFRAASDLTLKRILLRVLRSHAVLRQLCTVCSGHASASLPLETGLLRTTASPALLGLESLFTWCSLRVASSATRATLSCTQAI